jgi:hypothetical protein
MNSYLATDPKRSKELRAPYTLPALAQSEDKHTNRAGHWYAHAPRQEMRGTRARTDTHKTLSNDTKCANAQPKQWGGQSAAVKHMLTDSVTLLLILASDRRA